MRYAGRLISIPHEKKEINTLGTINIDKLNPHPKNSYYFTDIEGDKYEEIKQSILNNGIRDSLKVTTYYTILSGHQRYRIAQDLGLKEVPVEIVDVNELEAEYLLIAENTERRGEAELDPIKKGRIASFIKEYWGITHGGNKARGQNNLLKNMKDVAKVINESERDTKRLIRLNDLVAPIQRLVSSGRLSKGAAEQLSYLTEDEQRILFEQHADELGDLKVNEMSQLRKETEQLRKQLDDIESQKEKLEQQKQQMLSTINQLKNREPEVVEVVKEVVPNHIKQELQDYKSKYNEELRNGKTLQSTLNKLHKEKQELEDYIKSDEYKALELDKQNELLAKQAEQKRLMAHVSISELQINIHDFIEKNSGNVFLQGAVAASTIFIKKDLYDSVLALESFSNSLRNMIQRNENPVIDINNYEGEI